jgi:predicted nuclease of predicted toxin-antitoxin system
LSKVHLSQVGFLQNIIDKFLVDKSNKKETPSGNVLFETKDSEELKDKNKYLSCIMSLMYLARLTRPDILLPVTFLASRSHIATLDDFNKLQRVLAYLNHTSKKVLTLECKDLKLFCCCDASYGVHKDRKSHTGFLLKLGGALINSGSVKQKHTAISSTDAEIIALAEATKTIIWVTNLLKEITDFDSVAEIAQDNRSAIWLTTEPSKAKRSKHLLTKIAFIKEQINNGTMKILQKRSKEMMSDGLTKPLQGSSFSFHTMSLVGIINNK